MRVHRLAPLDRDAAGRALRGPGAAGGAGARGFRLLRSPALSAADLLWQHLQEGCVLPSLPAELRPATRAEGYAIQAGYEQRSAAPLFGWKIAATSRAGQAHINVDGPIAGRLLRERARDSGADLSLRGNRMRVAEPEFAFRMAAGLTPRPSPYSVDEVLAAVATLHPAIEVPDSRYQDYTKVGAAQLIADNACADRFVLGAPTDAAWRGLDLAAHRVVATMPGRPPIEGSGADVLGDPRQALAWLVNELSGLGLALAAGAVVTTGTCTTPLPIAPGDEVTADFGVLGQVTARFSA